MYTDYPGHFPWFLLGIFNLILADVWSQGHNNHHLSARLLDIVTNDQTWSRGTKLISAAGDQAGIICPVKFLLTRLKRLGGARHCDQSSFVGFPSTDPEFVPRLCPVLGPNLRACLPGAHYGSVSADNELTPDRTLILKPGVCGINVRRKNREKF